MAQFFDNQYFNTEKYKTVKSLDINTDLGVRHPRVISDCFKTLLHRMRNIAKTNYRLDEVIENRKPRIQYCGYSTTLNDETPVNMCSSKSGSIFFNGLANCGSYWRCPVCAVKISENKKELISRIITQHQEKNKRIGFITLTIRHTKYDTLKKSLDKILDNYKRFYNTRFFKKYSKSNGFIGQIKTLEITYSYDNGWHPHLHILFFYGEDSQLNEKKIELFQKQILTRWAKFRDNNALVSGQNQQILTNDISDYVAKYDISMEMTKGQIKGSKGLTPFTALAKLSLNQFETIEEKRRLYGIYSNYVDQTFGRHFVNISRELKKHFPELQKDIEKTEQEIVDEMEIDKILMKISVDIWRKIAKNDLQPLIINKYKENGIESVLNLLIFFKDFQNLEVEIDKNEIYSLI